VDRQLLAVVAEIPHNVDSARLLIEQAFQVFNAVSVGLDHKKVAPPVVDGSGFRVRPWGRRKIKGPAINKNSVPRELDFVNG
jgi:hypothetical protein